MLSVCIAGIVSCSGCKRYNVMRTSGVCTTTDGSQGCCSFQRPADENVPVTLSHGHFIICSGLDGPLPHWCSIERCGALRECSHLGVQHGGVQAVG